MKKNYKNRSRNHKKIKIIIIEKPQPRSFNKLLYLIPIIFLLFNGSNLLLFAPILISIYSWYNKQNNKKNNYIDDLVTSDNQMNMLYVLPILALLFIGSFIFFYILFSYSNINTSLPCIQE
jgi:hypothetical protein